MNLIKTHLKNSFSSYLDVSHIILPTKVTNLGIGGVPISLRFVGRIICDRIGYISKIIIILSMANNVLAHKNE